MRWASLTVREMVQCGDRGARDEKRCYTASRPTGTGRAVVRASAVRPTTGPAAATRLAAGLCIRCPAENVQKATRGQRCEAHAAANNVRTLADYHRRVTALGGTDKRKRCASCGGENIGM